MAALPVGMQLVSALDDAELQALSPVGSQENDASSAASEHVRRALLLPLEGDDVDVGDMDMDIDVDVFRPSAMLSDVFGGGDSTDFLFASSFQPELGEAGADIEQMLLCGGTDDAGLQSHHQHETAPGQGCQCRNFAIQANRVQTQQQRVAAAVVAKDHKRVLRHTFGSGKKLQDFGFGEGAVMDQTQQQDIEMGDGRSTPAPALQMKQEVLAAEHAAAVAAMAQMVPEPIVTVKQEVPSTPERVLYKSRSLDDEQMFSSPLHRSMSLSAVSSPLSTTSFVSLESMMATPLSTTSRASGHPEMPVMMRSLSPADELEKMTASGSKTSMPKMNMLRGNFQVSPGHDSVPLVKPTAVLPPPYFRGALDSPEKRRAHSKTFNSFAQSLSFSFSNESSTDSVLGIWCSSAMTSGPHECTRVVGSAAIFLRPLRYIDAALAASEAAAAEEARRRKQVEAELAEAKSAAEAKDRERLETQLQAQQDAKRAQELEVARSEQAHARTLLEHELATRDQQNQELKQVRKQLEDQLQATNENAQRFQVNITSTDQALEVSIIELLFVAAVDFYLIYSSIDFVVR
ncbi:hypothetical protein PHYSODRAFT_507321 [Phytophthora sojae]|uniref:Uncharacterized protein n=1 Tax=Phytophthora sojae (strain P6497) TaxID=1094619 RepID=G4ZQ97_PHYSP|nr:hypothetical protein PHYSODRAFT_507321 [Phytophthora sojae]EGZ14808.1 hypothetical protein PHYSODRAFT_507321 [Phytophthora sojae]|eukprot:XP_009528557.1 hypothetical protein PHYSODRAFT_507321 [Phytophthora sojae]